MSKVFRSIILVMACALLILQFFNKSAAQDMSVEVKIDAKSPATAIIKGRFAHSDARKNLSFLREYAGIDGLGDRISYLELETATSAKVAFKRLIPGEYLAEGGFDTWSYKLNLSVNTRPSAAAHISWVDDNTGLLILDDLLPQTGSSDKRRTARVILTVPAGWKIWTTEKDLGQNVFEVTDTDNSVFVIGKDFREVKTSNPNLKLIISDQWQFADSDAADITREIYSGYRKLFGADPTSTAQITVLKFPQTVQPGMWEADTRGGSVTIVSADMPFKTQSIQRLHEQLRHEIFHLWLPNGVNLSGNYDWFYEGFALYTALKSGVAVNRIRFDDFLDTLSRAYNIDNISGSRASLIDASKSRWSGANTQIYARGMLVAFLCDLALLERSKGKRDVNDLLRKIYDDYRYPKPRQDGNLAVLNALQSYPELAGISKRYIKGAEKLDWHEELVAAGIESREENYTTFLQVTAKPNGRQKDLLNKLGYNNWQKLTQNSR